MCDRPTISPEEALEAALCRSVTEPTRVGIKAEIITGGCTDLECDEPRDLNRALEYDPLTGKFTLILITD